MVRGFIFDEQNNTSKNWGTLLQRMFSADGLVTGCAISFTGDTATVGSGYFVMAGRGLQIDGSETVRFDDIRANGYVQLKYRIDLGAAASPTEFTQGNWAWEYSGSTEFAGLRQEDINATGTVYEMEFAVFQITGGSLHALVRRAGNARIDGDTLGGLLPAAYASQADMNNALTFRRALSATDNLNGIAAPGVYYTAAAASWEGNNYPPVTAAACLVLVCGRSTTLAAGTVQMVIPQNSGHVLSRIHTGSAWTAWTTTPAKQSDMDRALTYRATLTTENLNNIFRPGVYDQGSASNTSAARNYPALQAGALMVAGRSTTDEVPFNTVQTYITNYTTHVYTRTHNGSAWTAWTALPATQADMDMAMAFRGELGTKSLNNAIQNGMYRQQEGDLSLTSRNYPVNDEPGSLLVFSNIATTGAYSRVTQLYIVGDGAIYTRQFYGAAWHNWNKMFSAGGGTVSGNVTVSGQLTAAGATTTANGANVFMNDAGRLYKSTSSETVKTNLRDIVGSGDEKALRDLTGIVPKTFNSRCDGDDPAKTFVGFSADEIARVNANLARLDGKGNAAGYDINALVATLWRGWQLHEARIKELEDRGSKLFTLLERKGLLDDKDLKGLI